MTVKTLIVDDMLLARKRLARHLSTDPDVEIVGECSGGQDAIDAIRRLTPELVFLDVQMPEIGGFEVLEAVGARAVPAVVFVTAYDQFALKAFEVHALDYLLKPFDPERLTHTVQRAKRQIQPSRVDRHQDGLEALLLSLETARKRFGRIAVKVDGKIVFLAVDEVDFVEAAGNYVRIQAGAQSYMIRERISQMEEQLDPEQFVRVHRSTIVNVSRIKEMFPLFNGDQTLILTGGRQLTLSRTFRERLMSVLDRS
jgi:two-component system, LytTR family, response regulator